jgi:hypothetical protein
MATIKEKLMNGSSGWFSARFALILCAAVASHLANPLLGAQGSNGSTRGGRPADQVQDSSVRLTNPYYTYPSFELWDPAKWKSDTPKTAPILSWIEDHEEGTHADYVVKNKYKGIRDFVGNPDYTWKTENITDPDIVSPLTHLGLRVDIREGGGFQIFVVPEKVLADRSHKVPILIVPHVLDKKDVFWAMNTLVHFKKYNELCAQRGDFIIVYMVMDKAAAGHGPPLSAVMDQATDIYCGDYKRVYLDISVFADSGARIADLPGLNWSDDDETKLDPNSQIEHLGFIPALNVAGKWNGKPAAGIGIARPRTDIRYNPQRILHGKLGEHWMEGISFLYSHGTDHSPEIKANFDEMGLVIGEHSYEGERWLIFSPRKAVEQSEKLPLVLILTEVYDYDRYAISTAYADYLDYFKLAAEGDLNILLFARESPDTMDSAYEIIKEAEKSYPIDSSRIYVTGHSHDGHLAREFAYRHPDMVAAAAPLGNSSGLAAPAYSHEAVVVDDQRIEAWSKIDMPIITIGAASEVTSPHSMPSSILNDYGLFIEAWQRRLRASRCPIKSQEDIKAAEHSDDYVTHLFGLPNDGSSLLVIDGVEHYVIDIRNVEGRKHLRIVGIENMVHTTEPTMPMIAWTFMRRFARDQQTGKVIELY